MNERQIIRRLARRVRTYLRAFRETVGVIYEDMAGACAIGSMILYKILRSIGLPATFVVGWWQRGCHRTPHAWLELDGEIIDVTATQFGYRTAVLFTDAEDDHYERFSRGPAAIRHVNAWDKGQSPADHADFVDAAVSVALG